MLYSPFVSSVFFKLVGHLFVSLEEGPSMEAPNVEVGPSPEAGSNAETGAKGELLRCRACGSRVSGAALFQGKFCSSACAQPSSGR